MSADHRLDYPATARNQQPILEVLREVLFDGARVLEVASGSGQHAHAFTRALPDVHWQPSSMEARERASIDAWGADESRLPTALDLDVRRHPWPVEEGGYDVVFCANMIHIAPWSATPALFQGAARALRGGGRVLLYGPFVVGGQATAPSNLAFHDSLRARDPAWGLRELDRVQEVASLHGFELGATRTMPANNLVVDFVRS